MYFPLLRGKLNELLALRELAPWLAESDKIVPIVEPVNANDNTLGCLERYVAENMRFALIVNPRKGKVTSVQAVLDKIVSQCLEEYDNYVPTLHVNGATSDAELDNLRAKWPGLATGVLYESTPTGSVAGRLREDDLILFHMYVDGKTSPDYLKTLPPTKKVCIRDPFPRVTKNADYPADSLFTNQHRATPNDDVCGFGDYSIVGDDYSESGGPAYAVALHHMYFSAADHGNLHVRHFLSDRQDSRVDTEGKYLEALAKLVAELPGLGDGNRTATCRQYESFHDRQHFPGLGFAKRMAIKHHLELMWKFYEAKSKPT